MTLLKVNPNRMEVLKLRKRLRISERGHRLLKQKQDELMKILNSLIEETKQLRAEAGAKTAYAYKLFFFAEASNGSRETENIIRFSGISTRIESGTARILSLSVPEVKIIIGREKPGPGFLNADSGMDEALSAWEELLPLLGRLYELETRLAAVAEELEKTRRRVNALEYILIPDIRETIRHIIMKLEEIERGSRVRLMKVKELKS